MASEINFLFISNSPYFLLRINPAKRLCQIDKAFSVKTGTSYNTNYKNATSLDKYETKSHSVVKIQQSEHVCVNL
jgi:hypothetical protein